MSSDDFHATPNSPRQSSEDTLSERTISDDAQTTMTSVLDSDEAMTEDMEEDSEGEHENEVGELQSIYAPSQYPQVLDHHRTEIPHMTAESFISNSDV